MGREPAAKQAGMTGAPGAARKEADAPSVAPLTSRPVNI
jgi:hypothetical protein